MAVEQAVTVDTMDLVKAIFDSRLINYSVDDLTDYMVIVSTALLPVFYCINWVWSFAKHTFLNIGEKPKFLEKADLYRGALLWMLVASYPYAFGAIESLAFEIIAQTEPANYAAWKANHGAIAVEMLNVDASKKTTDEGSIGGSPSTFDILGSILKAIGSMGSGMITQIFVFLGYIVSIVVGGLSYLISKVFFIIGPLAITFSILPPFKDKLDKWFGVWLGVTLNLLTLNLLTSLLIGVTMDSVESVGVAIASGEGDVLGGNYFAVTIFNVIIIVMYVLSFWITSFIVGSSDAGKVLSTAVGAATSMMAYGAMKGGAAAQGGGAAGAATSAVPNVLGATKNTQ